MAPEAKRGFSPLLSLDERATQLITNLVFWVVIACIVAAPVMANDDGARLFEPCEEAFAEPSEDSEAKARAKCFYDIALETGQWAEAARRLEARVEQIQDMWLRLYLALASRQLDETWSKKTEPLFRQAIQGFARSGDVAGEAQARRSYRHFLERKSRHEEAREQLDESIRLSKMLTGHEDQLRTRLLLIRDLHDRKQDMARVLRMYRELEMEIVEAGLTETKLYLDTLVRAGAASSFLGRNFQAKELWRHAAVLAEKQQNLIAVATISFNLFLAELYLHDRFPTERQRNKIIRIAEETLQLSLTSGNRSVEHSTRLELGKLLGYPDGVELLRHCVEQAQQSQNIVLESECLISWALILASVDPQTALERQDQALQVALQTNEPRTIAAVYASALVVSWETSDPEQAMRVSLDALDKIEALRSNQTGHDGRSELFSEWVPYYQRLVGYLLRAYQASGDQERLAQAFQVSERMRSRVLQEALDLAAYEADISIPEELSASSMQVQRDMNQVNRHLLEDELSSHDRQRYERDLERLEIQWEKIRHQILALQRGSLVAPDTPDRSLRQVQDALAPQEALIAYQLAPEQDIYRTFFGGSWAMAITKDRVTVHELGDGTFLPKKIEFLLGLVQNRSSESDRQALEALYSVLLSEVVEELPAHVDHLILLPDGALHSLPFRALQDGSGETLGERFQVTRSPSATLWLRWRKRPVDPSPLPALVLADPELDPGAAVQALAAETRGGETTSGLVHRSELGQLPLAREEGRDLMRHLGRKTYLRAGREATEALVQSLDLTSFRVLHFAAHAKADTKHPDRSAIYLARSGTDLDGLLQFREIVDLDLDGRIVVLSACDTAAGEILRGEGVLDLARAFFQGGAHAVVASLWPLRDDDGRDFFDAFYRHLAEGESLAGALQGAQIDRIGAGAPAAAWAGIVVLGDGSLVPFPEATARLPFAAVTGIALALFLLAAGVATWAAKR